MSVMSMDKASKYNDAKKAAEYARMSWPWYQQNEKSEPFYA